MCGVVAVCGSYDPDALDRAVRALAHRGPDGHGVAAFDGAILGHTRLALVDVAGGAQPIMNEDGTVACVVSGELYDDVDIRRELEARGHRFRTGSDSEIAVHLYEEHGAAFVDRLRGEFAIILWDARRRRMLCARDRFGVRPLVYWRSSFGVAVASEAKALFALGAPRRWDMTSVWTAMCAQYTLPHRTLFADVEQVAPGCLLIVEQGMIRTERYWDIDFPKADDKRHVTSAQVRAALDDAVQARTRGEHDRLACALSGGIDSTAVAALASKRARVECFTLSFKEDDYDELAVAERTAAHIGTPLHVVHASGAALWNALTDAVAQSEGLTVNLHLPAKWLLARDVKRAGISVLLTGEGADEALGGYPHLRRDVLLEAGASTHDLAAGNMASAGLMMPDGDALDTSAVARALGFVPSFLEAKAALGKRAVSLLSFSSPSDAYGEIVEALDVGGQLRGRERIDQSSYIWCKLALAGYILRTLGDGAEMAHAVEGRVPFLDHRFFELVRATPTADKIRGDVEKYLLRDAMKADVPEEVIARRKHPLLAPPVALSDDARDALSSRALPAFFNRAAVEGLLERSTRADGRERKLWDPPLMMVLSATLLAQRFELT
jgi:asparagine synthase (glutamine-hydrolysing)